MREIEDAAENKKTVLFVEDSSAMPPAVELACARLQLKVTHLRKVESTGGQGAVCQSPSINPRCQSKSLSIGV